MSNKVGIFMFGVDVGWQHETHAVQLVTGGGVLNNEKGKGGSSRLLWRLLVTVVLIFLFSR